MRRLWLLRHATACPNRPPSGDLERPLAERGRREAPLIGTHMARQGYRPELVLRSPARRTRETWSGVRDALDCDAVEEVREEIYQAAPPALLGLVRSIDDRCAGAVVIGHNPGIAVLATELAGPAAPEGNPFVRFAAGSLAAFDLDVEGWADVGPGCGRLLEFVRPADLGAR